MNKLSLMQAAFLAQLPKVADVISGAHVIQATSVVLIVGRRDKDGNPSITAGGPYPVKDIEWHRLKPDDRVYEGDLL